MPARSLPSALLMLLLTGCSAASALTSVVSAPVKLGSSAVDMATTSQSEADERRGRALRLEEARLGMLDRRYREASAACTKGDAEACTHSDTLYAQIAAIRANDPPPR